MANDEHEDVRASVAERVDLSQDLVEQLSCDKSSKVRLAVAVRKDLSQDLVEKLALDESIWVRGAIKKCYGITQEPEPQDLTM
ncbi:hypothetical protein CA604_05625 [Taylorella equigenitalis]|nr:hypothetical protein CA604_05625 [Taylorella equigenitalis]